MLEFCAVSAFVGMAFVILLKRGNVNRDGTYNEYGEYDYYEGNEG